MSCPYYYWKYDYTCRKTGKEVNSDIYNRYCSGYSYEDCPIYKQEEESDGCFLTSACVRAKGLSDDCYELTILRKYRDEVLLNTEAGKEEIKYYYYIAPLIVEEIEHNKNSEQIWNDLYKKLVKPCVELIELKKYKETYELYKSYVKELQAQYSIN